MKGDQSIFMVQIINISDFISVIILTVNDFFSVFILPRGNIIEFIEEALKYLGVFNVEHVLAE